MPEYDVMIKNGYVVFPNEVRKADIGITDGVITNISNQLTGTSVFEWHADNQYIFPGMIDVHVHFSEPGREHWEGFETGSAMMAAGGCTTFFDMPLNGIPSTVTKKALKEKAALGIEKSVVDFGLWGGLVPGNLSDLAPLAEAGVVGFKAFLSPTGNKEFEAVDDNTLLMGMKTIASLNKILALHAESAAITEWLKHEKEKKGLRSANDYAESRPVLAEAEAVGRALTYAEITRCPLHFVHISSTMAIEKIEAAKQRGLNVTVETCPHYLLFNHGHLVEKGSIAKCAPPLRSQSEQDRLRKLLLRGKFDMISSDHSPCPYELKNPKTRDIFQAWGGISGGQFSLMAMIELALTYQIPLPKIANLTASAPAKRFGLSLHKGEIRTGMDADFAIVSLEQIHHVTKENFYAKNKHSLYMDHTFPCKIVATFNRGKLVAENGHIINHNKKGSWIKVKSTRSEVSHSSL